MLGVYVHLPFCPYLCPYCDFAKWPLRAAEARRYLDALYTEIDREAPAPAATIYLGGGTPNAYDAAAITALVRYLQEKFVGAREITIEVNPELVRPGDLLAYRAAGVTRLSIGVQSFEPSEIKTLGRKHTAAAVERVVGLARNAKFESLSLDLMFAVPEQTQAGWRRTLAAAIALAPDHISAYGLTVEEGTPFAAWRARRPEAFLDDAAEAQLYAIAIDTLHRAGYEQYEISNFARSGHRCLHNLNYWANGAYIGFGVGAASYRDGVRRANTRSLQTYTRAALEGMEIPGEAERLHGRKRVGEAIMLALRTAQGVSVGEFKERYSIDVLADFAPVVTRFSQMGLLERDGDNVRLTQRGRFLANDVCGAFITSE